LRTTILITKSSSTSEENQAEIGESACTYIY